MNFLTGTPRRTISPDRRGRRGDVGGEAGAGRSNGRTVAHPAKTGQPDTPRLAAPRGARPCTVTVARAADAHNLAAALAMRHRNRARAGRRPRDDPRLGEPRATVR